jgi:hypothetical protein
MSLIGVQIVLDSRSSSAILDHSAATRIRLCFGVISMDMVFSNKLVPTDSAHGHDPLPIWSLYIECVLYIGRTVCHSKGLPARNYNMLDLRTIRYMI